MYRIAALALVGWVSVSSPAFAWVEVRTPHYLLLGNAAPGEMKRIAQRFEQFHALMQQVLSHTAVSSATPTVVLVFRDAKSFRPYLPLYQGKALDRGGIFVRDGYVNYVGINAEGGQAAYPIVFHELVHQITTNVSEISATWFREGVAEYYSSFEVRGDSEVLLGMPISEHALLLREQFMPLRELLATDHSSPAYNEERRSSVFYAESWALLHYLRFSPTTRERFGEFMRLAELGTPQEQAITKAFGISLTALESALRSYVRQFQVLVERKTLRAPLDDADVRVSNTTPDAVLPYLAGLQAAVGREDEAERALEAAGARLPPTGGMQAVLAQIRLRKGRRAEALAALQRDVPYAGVLDHYLGAATLARYLADASEPAAATRERDALRAHAAQATAAQPDVPEAWRLLAFAHLLVDEPKEAQNAVERALLLAPKNDYYRFTYAESLVRQRDFTRARSVLGLLMAHGRTSEIRADARRIMGQVVSYELALKQPGGSTAAPPPSGAPNTPESPRSGGAGNVIPVFRTVESGETRVFGTLAEIACGRDGVTLVLRVNDAPLRVAAASFDSIEFITYRTDLTGSVTCGARDQLDAVFVTWRGPQPAAETVRTDFVSVEFTP
jgi:tetratricopeptide (TPR) repeat protein